MNLSDDPLWDSFLAWAEEHGVEVTAEDDDASEHEGPSWTDWWDCFKAGSDANEETFHGFV